MTSSCGGRSRNAVAPPTSGPATAAGAAGARLKRIVASSSNSAVRMVIWLSGPGEAFCKKATPPLSRRGSKGAISESLYAIVDSKQELPPVQLEVDLLRLGALVGDVGRIEHVVDLEQHRESVQAVAELVAGLKIGDLVTMDELERAVVREVRDFADVLGARAR